MKMTVEWDVAEHKTAEVDVPEDATPKQRFELAQAALAAGTVPPQRAIRGTAHWATEDGQFGGVIA